VGSSASLNFSGTSFALLYTAHQNHGQVDVYIDGIYAGTVDQYSAYPRWQMRWNSLPLADGDHTVTLIHSSGRFVVLDGFIIE